MVSLEFLIDINLQTAYGPGVDSASNRNEYQEYFLGSKGGQGVGLISLPPSCADWLEIGSLNLLKPSRPVQACNILRQWSKRVKCNVIVSYYLF